MAKSKDEVSREIKLKAKAPKTKFAVKDYEKKEMKKISPKKIEAKEIKEKEAIKDEPKKSFRWEHSFPRKEAIFSDKKARISLPRAFDVRDFGFEPFAFKKPKNDKGSLSLKSQGNEKEINKGNELENR